MNIASRIDHTLLKPACLEADIARLCQEAISHQFYAVCIPPFYVNLAEELLAGQGPKICTVIGFPFGYDTLNTKLSACDNGVSDGADEIDMVINISALKTGKLQTIYSEIEGLAQLCHQADVPLKVIIETSYLNKDEIRMVCGIGADAGADFIKTSTGFSDKGATIEDVVFLREILPERIKIKASGGIKTYDDAISFINAGADRLGTSNGIKIIDYHKKEGKEVNSEKDY